MEKHKGLKMRKESTARAIAVTELLEIPKHREQYNLCELVFVVSIL